MDGFFRNVLLGGPAAIVGLLLGLFLALAPKIARQWERAVVLRLGRYEGLKEKGALMLVPQQRR